MGLTIDLPIYKDISKEDLADGLQQITVRFIIGNPSWGNEVHVSVVSPSLTESRHTEGREQMFYFYLATTD